MQESMLEKYVVWYHGKNLFLGFKCKYCLKTYWAGGVTSLKEYLVEKSENITGCTKCPPHVRSYFWQELKMAIERKKTITEERLHRVERPSDFDTIRAKAPVQTRIGTGP
jgi:hypothetical protein